MILVLDDKFVLFVYKLRKDVSIYKMFFQEIVTILQLL